jgi:hypothetical protein
LAILRSIGLLLLGSWLGAALFFSAVVAPAAFSVLRSFHVENATEIAGAIVNRSLAVVNTGGFLTGVIVLLIVLVLGPGNNRIIFILLLISVVLLMVMTGVGQWVIAAKMHALRTAMALPLEQISADDPHRIAFNNLHRYSVSALSIAMIAALIGYFLLVRTPRQH